MKIYLKQIRKERGLTIRELGRLSGVSISVISKIENRITSPKAETLYRLCYALGVSMDQMIKDRRGNLPLKRQFSEDELLEQELKEIMKELIDKTKGIRKANKMYRKILHIYLED